MAYGQKGEYDIAIEDLNKAIELNPQFFEAYNNRGTCYMYKGEFDKAIPDYDKAIELYPKYYYAYYNKGLAHKYRGEFDQAIADFSKSIEISTRYSAAYLQRGTTYQRIGNIDKALADFDKLVMMHFSTGYYHSVLGVVYHLKGDYDKAISEFKLAARYSRNDAYPYLWRAISSFRVSDDAYHSAREKLRKFIERIEKKPKDEWVRTISKYYLSMDGVTEEMVLDGARNGENEMDINMRLCDAYYFIGEAKLARGDRAGAKESFMKILETADYCGTYSLAEVNLMLMRRGKK